VSRKFVREDFERFDRIYAMADDVMDEMKMIAGVRFNAVRTDLLLNEIYPGKNWDVPDPWYGTEAGYHEVFELINKACVALIKKYTGEW